MGVVFIVLLFAAVFAVLAVAVPFAYGRATQGRWGERVARAELAGAGPYRDGTLVLHERQGAPWWVRLTAGLSGLWGVVTVFVFAPGGLLFVLVSAERTPVIALLALLVSLHGFWVGGRLGWSGVRLLKRKELSLVRTLPLHTALHHAAVLSVFALASLGTHDDLVEVTLVPCAIGVAMAPLLTVALRRSQQAAPTQNDSQDDS